MATSLIYRVVDYITAVYTNVSSTMKVNKRRGIITCTELNVRIRFVTEAQEDEARRGYTGIITTGYAVDRFLDPWERDQANAALKERFSEVL
jgi:hypothetical protein